MDENFPVQLARRLRQSGHAVEHLVESGERGLPDSAIRRRLDSDENLVFLTQDTDFEDWIGVTGGAVIISRVPQALPIAVRVDMWSQALETFLADPLPFDLLPDGRLAPVDVRG